jgi:hypothetical protein
VPVVEGQSGRKVLAASLRVIETLPEIFVAHRFKQCNPSLVKRGNQDKRHFDGLVAIG